MRNGALSGFACGFSTIQVGIHVSDATFTEDHLLTLAAAADRRSSHPLAKAVMAKTQQMNLNVPEPTAFDVLQGRGVSATVNSIRQV